ncbi:MAG: DUF4276 family protein [Alphaproteobacteria bacterium]|nr:DUF4276 family protein [Alphaproteobacteria bacterium]
MVDIACIVEGHGEVRSIPVILRRIVEMSAPGLQVAVHKPFRLSRGKILNRDDELGRLLNLAAKAVRNDGGIIILFDADDECPRDLATRVRNKVLSLRPDKAVNVVVANRETEAWFIASASSLAGESGFPIDLETPGDPEGIRDAKGWIEARGISGKYSSSVDQPRLAARFDMVMAERNSRSFAKFLKDVRSLLLEA